MNIFFNYKNLRRFESPQEFYSEIKNGLQISKEVFISTMYFGDDEKAEEILKILKERQTNFKKSVVILDESRGMTPWFKDKIFKFNLENMIFAKRMNSIPLKRLSEYFSVFHSKIIIFDNKIIFTGSNLSEDYFLNRIDRYYSLENKEMAEYLKENFFNFLIKNSKKMNGINVIPSDIKFECENFKRIGDFNINNFNDFDKTLIYEGKSELTILKMIKDFKFDEIYVSTAYLNFPKSYFEILKDLNFKIFVSDPETNKFKNYGMFCGTVTELYKYSTLFTTKKLLNAEIYEFRKDGFTMHGKGIWAFSKTVCLTTIGSSNLNRRSFERDSELNVLLITKNLDEIEILREEVKFIIENSKRRTISELKRRRYNVFVILLFFLLNPFL